MITLGGGFSKGSTTSGSRCATKTRSRSSRLAARRGGRGRFPFRKPGSSPHEGADPPSHPSNDTSEVHRMKSLLSVTADTKAGEKEVSGETLAIRGGRPLTGRVEVKGAKNLATKAMVAALLGETTSVLRDVPDISDVQVVRSLLEVHGVRVEDGDEAGTLDLRSVAARCRRTSRRSTRTPGHPASRSCSAARCCTCSARRSSPTSAAAASATVRSTSTWTRCARSARSSTRATRASASRRPNGLHGANIELPYPSVGATEQVLLTAVKAKGVTELRNAAIEPEIMDLIAVLQKMGAIISYEPNRVILIEGVDTLQRLRPPLHLRPQRGRIVGVRRARDRRRHLRRRREAAGDAHVPQRLPQGRRLRSTSTRTASASAAAAPLKPVVVETDVHPGFMTDWQQPLIVALTQAEGRVDRARDRVREPARLHRGARADGRRHRRAPAGHRQPRSARPAPRARAGRRHHRARRRCTAPTSRCPTCAAATAT